MIGHPPAGEATPDRVCVGAITGAYGVRGNVRLKSFCAEPSAIADYSPLFTAEGQQFTVTLVGPLPNGFAARLSGVATREEAAALKGVQLYVDRARLPDPGPDEFYHADLIGLEVRDAGGNHLGRVAAVLNHGASDLLEIVGPGSASPLLLPFTRAVVPTVDLVTRRVIVDLPGEI